MQPEVKLKGLIALAFIGVIFATPFFLNYGGFVTIDFVVGWYAALLSLIVVLTVHTAIDG